MTRNQAIKTFAVAVFVALLAGVGTFNVGYGLAVFVVTFLGFSGYEFLTDRQR
jgi:hypothetical protein